MNNEVELIPVKGVLPSVQVQSDNVIYVPQAHKNKAGIVKEGDGVLIENGVVSLNKQTVEDMIDANKWVSYGFEQNLTEDEKGMARHNIGAGDNYFTGSYYDLTQKPHLNTNNTTGLDYGDEELNDTINLHKISKTGSFNDLKHVPQETLDFAESERQKSKNLLQNTLNGFELKADNDQSLIIYTKKQEVKYPLYFYVQGNINYPLSPSGALFKFTYSDGSVSYLTGTGFIPDENQNNIHNRFDGSKDLVTITLLNWSDNVGTIEFAQLEEGSSFTGYQPYNGAIVHEKNIFGASTLTLIYSKNSTDANLNKGKTNGIYETSGAVSIDFNEYDFALCKIRSDSENHDYTASLFMLIPLKYGVGLSGNYTGCISVENPYNVIRRNTAKINMVSIFATIPTTKDSISIFTTSHNEEQTPIIYETMAIDDIWGVKLLCL